MPLRRSASSGDQPVAPLLRRPDTARPPGCERSAAACRDRTELQRERMPSDDRSGTRMVSRDQRCGAGRGLGRRGGAEASESRSTQHAVNAAHDHRSSQPICVAESCLTSQDDGFNVTVPVHRCPLGRPAADATGDRTPCACMLPDIPRWISESRRRLAMLAQHQPLDCSCPRPFRRGQSSWNFCCSTFSLRQAAERTEASPHCPHSLQRSPGLAVTGALGSNTSLG